MTDRSRHPAAVFLIPAAFVLTMAALAVLSPDRAAAVIQRSGGLLVMLIAALLTFSVLLYAFLKARRRASVWTASLVSSTAVHIIAIILFFLLAEEEPTEGPPSKDRYRLSAAPPTVMEDILGQEVRGQLVKMPERTLRPIEENKAPRKEEPEAPPPRAHAELTEIKPETPAPQIPVVPAAALKTRDIQEELSAKSLPRVDLLPVKVVTMREAEVRKTEPAPETPRDTHTMELTQAAQAPMKLQEPDRKLQPDEGKSVRPEPLRPEPVDVPAVASVRPGVAETIVSKPITTPVDQLNVPAAQAPRPEQTSDVKASPQPQKLESSHLQLALTEKSPQPAPAPEKPTELAQTPAASLVRAEPAARSTRALTPAERLSAAGSRHAEPEKPVKMQDTMLALESPAARASSPHVVSARPKELKQGRSRTARAAAESVNEKPHAEISSTVESPSETVADIIAEATARLAALEPAMEERMESAAGKPMLDTQVLDTKAVPLAQSAGDRSQQTAPVAPAAIAAPRVQTGVAGADAPALVMRPATRSKGSASVPGARDRSLAGTGTAPGKIGPRASAPRDIDLAAQSAAAATGAQGLPDMAPGMAPVRKSSAGKAAAPQVNDRPEFAEARTQSGIGDSGETAARPSPQLQMDVTNALTTTMGNPAVTAPYSPAAETSLTVAETLRGTAASATAGREMVRFGMAAAAVQTGDARSGSAPGGTAISPRDLAATKVAMNPGTGDSLSEPASPAHAAFAKGTGTAEGKQSTLVQADSELRASLHGPAGQFQEGLQKTAGSAADSQPIATVGSVSSVARRDATGTAGAEGSAARMPGERGALSAGKVAASSGLGTADVARPSRTISATGSGAEDRSLAGWSVPAGSSGVSAGIAEGLTQVPSEGGLASGDVALTSAGVAARAATAGEVTAGSGTEAGTTGPANVTFAKAGGTSATPERAARLSAPLATSGGGSQPAERLVGELGEAGAAVAGPSLAGAAPMLAPGGARNVEAMPVMFSAPRAGSAGGQGSKSREKERSPLDGVGLMVAAKAGGGTSGGAAEDQVRREAPAAGGGLDRAPARLDVTFDLDSAASGHVRTEGLAEAPQQPASQGSHKALLSVGTAPRPESVPEKAIYQMRKPAKRKEFIVELGGTPETESAVERGLAWLARVQSDDGRWNLRAFKTLRECGGAGDLATEDAAMTGLVLLSFLGAGYTHTGEAYKENVRKGLEWITGGQTAEGDLRRGGTMYGQAIAAAALCESYSLTGDDRLIDPCRRAIAFILKAQNPEAGWRYQPRDDNDTSVTGWQILALKSAQIAGLKIPQEHFKWTGMWLDKVRKGKEGGLYCYKAGHPETPVMTAEGWFCQLFMSEQSRARGQTESIGYLMANLPAWAPENRSVHLYYWYYGTLAMYLSGAEEFKPWNEALRTALLKGQVKDGPAAGSWDPVDQLGPRGGRVYTTTAATLCLEVYYRFLPIYKMPKQPGK